MTDECPTFVDPGNGLCVNRDVCAACGRTKYVHRGTVMHQYTVYDHPADYPEAFVVRRFDISAGRNQAGPAWLCADLEEARALVQAINPGAYCIPRSSQDDPRIVEVWL